MAFLFVNTPRGGKKHFETLGQIKECPAGTLVDADDDYFLAARCHDVMIPLVNHDTILTEILAACSIWRILFGS